MIVTRKVLFQGIALMIALGALSIWPLMKVVSRRSATDTRALVGVNPPSVLFAFGSSEVNHGIDYPLAITGTGSEVFVSDAQNGRIAVFTPDGGFKRTIGDAKDSPGKLRYPYGLAVADGKLYVADMGAAAIRVYDLNGKYLSTVNKPGLLSKPTDLKIWGGRFYVADAGQHQVLVLDKDGDLEAQIGGPGEAEGRFRFPNGIAVVADGTLYVADSGNNRVQVFDKDGKFLKVIGSADRPLVAARGILVDNGTLYVVAGLLNRVVTFDLEGKEKFRMGAENSGPGSLFLPNGLYMDPEGRLYVTEVGNKRISVFR